MSRESAFHFELGFMSHQGLEKEINEDNYCAEQRESENGVSMGIIAISDGIGGFSLGEIASKIAVNQVEKFYKLGEFKQMFEEAEFLEPKRVIQELYTRINHVVRTLMEKENRPVGCTLVSGFFYGDYVYIAGVGNSRAYIIRGNAIKKLTEDRLDPLAGNDLSLTNGDENLHGARNSTYVNALGSDITLRADITQMKSRDGDIFLFCTDGLFTQIKEDEMIRLAKETPNMQAFCNALIEKANFLGGKDNVSAVALRVSAAQPSFGDMMTDWKKSGRMNPRIIVMGLLLLFALLIGLGVIGLKYLSTRNSGNDPINGRPTHQPGRPGGIYNSLTINTDIPLQFINVNDETRKLDGPSGMFVFDRDNNEIKINPDFNRMKPQMYILTMVGTNRNFSIVQARKNRIELTPQNVTLYLTAGSRADFKVRQERTGDLFELKVDHLGSAFTIAMDTQENAVVELRYQAEPGGINPGSSSGNSSGGSGKTGGSSSGGVVGKPGKKKGEKFNFKLE